MNALPVAERFLQGTELVATRVTSFIEDEDDDEDDYDLHARPF